MIVAGLSFLRLRGPSGFGGQALASLSWLLVMRVCLVVWPSSISTTLGRMSRLCGVGQDAIAAPVARGS